jgi:hypothetical protein
MATRSIGDVWLAAVVVGAVLVGAMWRPFMTAWDCYADWSGGTVALGEVVEATAETGLVLRFEEPGQETCKAHLGASSLSEYELGDRVLAYRRADRPGVCELEVTIDAARALLVASAALLVALLLGILLVAKVVSRSLSETPSLTTQFDTGQPLACPRCTKPMAEGYLPLLAGIHWRRVSEPVGIPHALKGLPGTVGWWGRPRVHAYRCEACEVVTFRYGA